MRYPVAILAVAAVALAACERPANTAYNNSGQSAATAPGPIAQNTTAAPPAATTSTATSDTASPSVATGVAAPKDETATSARILSAITSDSGMRDADVSVKTENGVVTLGGTAKSQDQVAIATDIAQKQQGVARVETQIALK